MKLKSFTYQDVNLSFDDTTITKISGDFMMGKSEYLDALRAVTTIICGYPVPSRIDLSVFPESKIKADLDYELVDAQYDLEIEFANEKHIYKYKCKLEHQVIIKEELLEDNVTIHVSAPNKLESIIFKCEDKRVDNIKTFCNSFAFITPKPVRNGVLPYKIVDTFYNIKSEFSFWEPILQNIEIDGLTFNTTKNNTHYFEYNGKPLNECTDNTLMYLYALITIETHSVVFFDDVDEYIIYKAMKHPKPGKQIIYTGYPSVHISDIQEIEFI